MEGVAVSAGVITAGPAVVTACGSPKGTAAGEREGDATVGASGAGAVRVDAVRPWGATAGDAAGVTGAAVAYGVGRGCVDGFWQTTGMIASTPQSMARAGEGPIVKVSARMAAEQEAARRTLTWFPWGSWPLPAQRFSWSPTEKRQLGGTARRTFQGNLVSSAGW